MMRVTFDSNVWEFVVSPEKHPNNPNLKHFITLHNAMRNRQLFGFVSDTVFSIEAIQKKFRPDYLASLEGVTSNGTTIEIHAGGNPDEHPGVHEVLKTKLQKAVLIGMKFIPCLRFGIPIPAIPEISENYLGASPALCADILNERDQHAQISQQIESKGVGFGRLMNVAQRIQNRSENVGIDWLEALTKPKDRNEKKEIEQAFAEWSDGDSIAYHIRYGLDVFCTNDIGNSSSSASILDLEHREWLQNSYGIKFKTVAELAKCYN